MVRGHPDNDHMGKEMIQCPSCHLPCKCFEKGNILIILLLKIYEFNETFEKLLRYD